MPDVSSPRKVGDDASNTAGTLEALFHVPVVVMTMSQTGLKMAETRGQAETRRGRTRGRSLGARRRAGDPGGRLSLRRFALRLLAGRFT